MNQTRLLTAFFDSMADAQRAVDHLVQAGVPRDEIQMIAGADAVSSSTTPGEAPEYHETGFWASLKNLFVPEEDRHSYAEGLRRGGYLVSLRPAADKYERALGILDDQGAVNLDEREQNWRSEGWAPSRSERRVAPTSAATPADAMATSTPVRPATASSAAAGTGSLSEPTLGANIGLADTRSTPGAIEKGAVLSSEAPTGMPAASSGALDDARVATTGQPEAAAIASSDAPAAGFSGSVRDAESARARAASAPGLRDTTTPMDKLNMGGDGDQTSPVADEQLWVGKRETDLGRPRVRSYIVENPGEKRFDREDSLDRRPLDRPMSGTDDTIRSTKIEVDDRRGRDAASGETTRR